MLLRRTISDIKQGKLFQLINKSFFRTLRPLGDRGEPPDIRTVEGNNPVRFTEIDVLKNNTPGTAICGRYLIRQRLLHGYSAEGGGLCSSLPLFPLSSGSCFFVSCPSSDNIASPGAFLSGDVVSASVSASDTDSGRAGRATEVAVLIPAGSSLKK